MAENLQHAQEKPKNTVDKEIRLRSFKERQNEERQRKLEDLKAQALAAQKFKEEKEFERRKRLEEIRVKDDQRRQMVEERKRAINNAEKDRLESIIRRNHERDARLEARRRSDRSNLAFAFGSSTPRMLDISVSFWGHRRATSTQNIPTSAVSLTRRQSERDLDASSKKRAISAGGFEKNSESVVSPTTPAGCASGYLGRRRTDLVPTVPSKDSPFNFSTSRKFLNQSPGRAFSMSRLDQLAKPRKPILPALDESKLASKISLTRSMSHLAHAGAKLSYKRLLNKTDCHSMHQLNLEKHSAPAPSHRVNRTIQLRQQKLLMVQQQGTAREDMASSRPSSSMSQQSINSVTSSVNVKHRTSIVSRRPRPISIAITGVTSDKSNFDKGEGKSLPKARRPLPKSNITDKAEIRLKSSEPCNLFDESTAYNIVVIEDKKDDKNKNIQEIDHVTYQSVEQGKEFVDNDNKIKVPNQPENELEILASQEGVNTRHIPSTGSITQDFINNEISSAKEASTLNKDKKVEQSVFSIISSIENLDTKKETFESPYETAALVSKPRITTEEEAKAALAERRRLMREEAERQAELSKQRLEAEQKAQLEKQREEEKQLMMLAEMQRESEQKRLQEAIREAQMREEEKKFRKEEEQKQKQLKEETDRKAKEEAERQKADIQKKLENEEREREERRKRVEMIMLRTRGKNNANIVSQLQENGTNKNSTQNGKDLGIVDNIISDGSVKNANTTAGNGTINTDSINSNNVWP